MGSSTPKQKISSATTTLTDSVVRKEDTKVETQEGLETLKIENRSLLLEIARLKELLKFQFVPSTTFTPVNGTIENSAKQSHSILSPIKTEIDMPPKVEIIGETDLEKKESKVEVEQEKIVLESMYIEQEIDKMKNKNSKVEATSSPDTTLEINKTSNETVIKKEEKNHTTTLEEKKSDLVLFPEIKMLATKNESDCNLKNEIQDKNTRSAD